MKIILSRKGFDSSAGGVPSPILPSSRLYSLPIPENPVDSRPDLSYRGMTANGVSAGDLVLDLTRGKVKPDQTPHLDPDLDYNSVPRKAGWKPLFGQAGAAESHLQKNGVKEGDIFLFFGWFRKVELVKGVYRYISNAPDLHVIFGWLQIERRIDVGPCKEIPDWAMDHAHCVRTKHSNPDVIYISRETMHLPFHGIDKSGAGLFGKFDPRLCLTMQNQNRSIWQLPGWLRLEDGKKKGLSYHRSAKRWTVQNDFTRLATVGRGQEFVLDCDEYPEALDWLADLLSVPTE